MSGVLCILGTWSSKRDRCVNWELQDSVVRPQCGAPPGAADRRGTTEPTGGVLVGGDIGVGLENEYHFPDGRQEPKVPPPRGTTHANEGRVGTCEAPEAGSGRWLCHKRDRRAQALVREESRPCSRYWIPGPETQGPTPALMELPVLRSSQITVQSHK